MTNLDMGCGPRKIPGCVGVDKTAFPGVDVVWDLARFPYPFDDDFADSVTFRHCLEHLDDPLSAVKEALRILKPGGLLTVAGPHFSSMDAYGDLTHRRPFAVSAFKNLCTVEGQDAADPGLAYRSSLLDGRGGFRFVKARFEFWPLHDRLKIVPFRWLGVRALANRFPGFYERFLAFTFPCQEIIVTLEAVKPRPS